MANIAKSSPGRNQEDKEREDYHTENYPSSHVSAESIIKAEERAKKEDKVKAKPKNFDINFIDDEVFLKELEYLPFTPQSDLVLLIGPRIEVRNSKSNIKLPEKEEQKLLSDELDKLPQGFRVIDISDKATGFALNGEHLPQTFSIGDYVIYKGNIQRLNPDSMAPLHDSLGYYQVRYIDVQYSIRHEDVLRFKPSE